MQTRRLFPILAALFFVTALTLFADNVKTDYDHSVSFSRYHTYSWGDVKTSNPLFVDRIKQAVDRQLSEKGWQLVPSGGNAIIFAVGNVQNQQQIETFYNGLGPGWGGGWGWHHWGWGMGGGFGEATTTTTNQPVGNLVLDIFDSQNRQLIFRGISSAELSNNSDKNVKKLDKDIAKMFDKFPPQERG